MLADDGRVGKMILPIKFHGPRFGHTHWPCLNVHYMSCKVHRYFHDRCSGELKSQSIDRSLVDRASRRADRRVVVAASRRRVCNRGCPRKPPARSCRHYGRRGESGTNKQRRSKRGERERGRRRALYTSSLYNFLRGDGKGER